MSTKPLPPAMKDPLLSAVVGKLPDPERFAKEGTVWSHAEREAWFELMRNVVDVAYGPLSPTGLKLGGVTAGAVAASDLTSPSQATRYVVAPDGTAFGGDRPIDPADIPSGTVLHDYRTQPVDEEYQPIMWKTHGAKKQALPAGVLLRAASEPFPQKGVSNGSAEATG